MKHLVELNNEFILETTMSAKQIRKEGEQYFTNDWVDEKKDKANCKQTVQNVVMHVNFNEDGYRVSTFQKIYIDVQDILKLAEKIKELQDVEAVAVPGDDLPF
jgi:hypothetical protein